MYEPNRLLDGEFDDDGLGCARGFLSAMLIMAGLAGIGAMSVLAYLAWAPVLIRTFWVILPY